MGPRRDWRGYSVDRLATSTPKSLQWGHAVIGVDTPRRKDRGACAAPLQWGHAVIGVDTRLGEKDRGARVVPLQWGHAVIGVDTGAQVGSPRGTEEASMGPRRDWRGYACADDAPVQDATASMGPRRDWRGYHESGACSEAGDRLQWGHAVIGVDTITHGPDGPGMNWLQWGHAVIGVDTLTVRDATRRSPRLQWGHAVIGVDTGSP